MSLIGSSIAQSIAGLSQAERAEAKAKAPASAKDAKRKDERDRVVIGTETADAVRDPKSNDQEETREDRQEHPGYSPQGSVKPPPPPAHLDVNG
jgi:hypothetical protein